jgi:hypothetical protein
MKVQAVHTSHNASNNLATLQNKAKIELKVYHSIYINKLSLNLIDYKLRIIYSQFG